MPFVLFSLLSLVAKSSLNFWCSFPVQHPSCSVDQKTVKHISRKNEECKRVQLLNERLQQLRLELHDVNDRVENMRQVQAAELRKLEETFFAKIETDVSTALREQKVQHKQEMEKAAAKRSAAEIKISELKEDVAQAKNRHLCQICFDHVRDCMIMPCTHLLYCRRCVAQYKSTGKNRCPACRGPINGEINCNLDF